LIELSKEDHTSLSSYTFIDLFSGIGAFHTALNSFGAHCLFASEIDKHAAKVYELNYGMKPHGDITQIDENLIPSHDILCAGFPCQPFSIAGNKKGFEDTRGTLFFDVLRIIKKKQPKIVFLENVKNFEIHDNGRTLTIVKNSLESLGYSFFYDLLNSSDFGVPQSRKRIYMLAFHASLDVKEFSFPAAKEIKRSVNDILEKDGTFNLDDYLIDRNDINIDYKLLENQALEKSMRLGSIGKGGQGERIYDPRGQAITLSSYGGGIAAKTGAYYINDVIRRLTVREACRLSGFSDDYICDSSRNQSYKQFGNTIVVDVLQEIITSMINQDILL
jgi:DNA (cytosine-5)-methyltransferase 1